MSLWHTSKFERVSCLAFVSAAMSLSESQPNFAGCMAVSQAGTLYIHFRGLLPVGRILRTTLAFSYIGSVTAWHSTSEHEPSFAAWYKEWNYRTFAEGATYIRLGGHHDCGPLVSFTC